MPGGVASNPAGIARHQHIASSAHGTPAAATSQSRWPGVPTKGYRPPRIVLEAVAVRLEHHILRGIKQFGAVEGDARNIIAIQHNGIFWIHFGPPQHGAKCFQHQHHLDAFFGDTQGRVRSQGQVPVSGVKPGVVGRVVGVSRRWSSSRVCSVQPGIWQPESWIK